MPRNGDCVATGEGDWRVTPVYGPVLVGSDDTTVRRHANANSSHFVADGEWPSRPTHNRLAFRFVFPPRLDCGTVACNIDDSPDNGRSGDIGEVANPPSRRPFDETAGMSYAEPRDESPTEISGTTEATADTKASGTAEALQTVNSPSDAEAPAAGIGTSVRSGWESRRSNWDVH